MRTILAGSARPRRRSLRPVLRCSAELLETRLALSNVPFGAMPHDTGEYFLGSVTVNVVGMESDGSIDPSTEDWTPAAKADVKQRIQDAMQWWSDTLANYSSVHTLSFTYDWTWLDDPIETRYEPINRQADYFADWVYDFLNHVGYNATGDFSQDIRSFNHAQRLVHGTNWSFTIFVVNSTNDLDDAFVLGGSFPRAFAFAGGQLFVTPSERPVSTYAHETAHIFWGLDEYSGGASYSRFRGYYNTQNTNSVTGAPLGFVQEPSIMSNGAMLAASFDTHTLPASTRALIGWQDSDGDGIFDVLDVPHSLAGAGRFDPSTRLYRFEGVSSVVPLANHNPEGLQNDITIAKISRAEFRVDGGPWQTAASYGTHTASLNLVLGPLPIGAQTIEIRTIDDATGVTSAVFSATTSAPATATTQPGVNGFVWDDLDADGVWDIGENGLEGWTVQLVDSGGAPLTLQQEIEPDQYTHGTILNNVLPGATLLATGSGVISSNVSARDNAIASTGGRVFKHLISTPSGPAWSEAWDGTTRMLRVNFASPVSFVRIDAIGNSDGDFGRLDAYNAAGQLIGRMTSEELSTGEVQTLSVGRPAAEIAYVIARGHAGTAVVLDNLRYGAPTAALTGAQGQYTLPHLAAGSYRVTVTPPNGWVFTSPATQVVALSGVPPAATTNVNFSLHAGVPTRPYQASPNRFDVDGKNGVTIMDLALLASWLQFRGSGSLLNPDGSLKYTPITAFVDVSGDNQATLTDLAQLASFLALETGGSSGSSGGGSSAGGGSSGEEAGSLADETGGPATGGNDWFPSQWEGDEASNDPFAMLDESSNEEEFFGLEYPDLPGDHHAHENEPQSCGWGCSCGRCC